MSFLQHYLRHHRLKLLLLCIISILLAGSILLQALSIVSIIDLIFIDEAAFADTFIFFWLFLIAIVFRLTMQWLLGRVGGSLALHVKNSIRKELLAHWSAASIEQHVSYQTGEQVTLFVDTVDQLESYYREYIPQVIKTIAVPLAIIVAVFFVHPNSAWIMLVTAPFVPITYIIIGLQTKKKSEEQLDALKKFSGKFLDLLQGLQTIRLFGQSNAQEKELAQSNKGFMTRTLSVLKIAFASTLFIELIATLGIGMVALEIGFQMIVFQTLTFAPAFFVLTLAPEYYNSLKELGAAFHTGRGSIGAANLVEQQLKQPLTIVHWGPQPLTETPSITLNEATFRYSTGLQIGPLNLTIEPRQTVAFIGRTGHGKTTILNMLSSLTELHSGTLLLNDKPRQSYRADDWYRLTSYISQQPYLFAGSLYENICMGQVATEDEVYKALENAKLMSWVNSLPNGLNTLIGEGGIGLSGGEKQRVALARAFLKQPRIVFFDEPTAGLDVVTERLLLASIERLRQTATVIIAAHRYESIRMADVIYYVEDGHITASGTPENFVQHPFYQQLLEEEN